MNLYKQPELKIGDTEETYTFYASAKEYITVQFSKWKGDTIVAAKFTIQNSDSYRDFKAAVKCVKGIDAPDEIRLSLHSTYSKEKTPRTQELSVDNLLIESGEKLRCCYIKYFEDEEINKKYSCEPYGTIRIPEIVRGFIIKRP